MSLFKIVINFIFCLDDIIKMEKINKKLSGLNKMNKNK